MALFNALFGTAKKTVGEEMASVMFDNNTAHPIRCHVSVKSTKVSGEVGPSAKGKSSLLFCCFPFLPRFPPSPSRSPP